MNAAEKLPYISEVQKEHKPLRALKNKGEKFPLRGKIKLYKFMDWKAFKDTLSKGLQFCEPSCWPDKFESRFYEANYSSVTHAAEPLPRQLYACCLALEGNCEAAWRIYGKGSVCVRLTIRRSAFLNLLARHVVRGLMEAYEGKVIYLKKYILSNLHIPNIQGATKVHKALFNRATFSLDDFLSLLLLKRDDFEYEKEVRYFLVPHQKREQKKYYLPIEKEYWITLVEKITLVNPMSGKEVDSLTEMEECRKFIEENLPGIPVEIYDPNEDEEIKKNGHITIIP